MLALDLGDRVQVRLVGVEHGVLARRASSSAHAGPSREPALAAVDRGHRSSSSTRVCSRASSSTSCSGPSVFSSVSRNSVVA